MDLALAFLLLAILPLRGMPLGDAAPGGLRMPPSPPPDALFPPPFAFPFFPFLSKLNALREPPSPSPPPFRLFLIARTIPRTSGTSAAPMPMHTMGSRPPLFCFDLVLVLVFLPWDDGLRLPPAGGASTSSGILGPRLGGLSFAMLAARKRRGRGVSAVAGRARVEGFSIRHGG